MSIRFVSIEANGLSFWASVRCAGKALHSLLLLDLETYSIASLLVASIGVLVDGLFKQAISSTNVYSKTSKQLLQSCHGSHAIDTQATKTRT